MLLIDSTMAVQFRSSAMPCCRQLLSPEDLGTPTVAVPWNRISILRKKCDSSVRRNVKRRTVQAHGNYLGSGSEQKGENGKSSYHPFEDILVPQALENEENRLTAAEMSRTVIEVNSKATLMFSGLINDEVEQSIFWPDLPYLTDEHGSIYFQVNNDEDIMQTLTSEDNYVQVIIGMDTKEMLNEIQLSGPGVVDFGLEELEDEDSDFDDENEDDDASDEDDDYEGEWVDILEDEADQEDSDESLGDWAKLATMSSSHPMYFASRLSEVASDHPVDYMEQPPAGLVIQGLLRPAFLEEHLIQKHRFHHQPDLTKVEQPLEDKVAGVGAINGHARESASPEDNSTKAEDVEKDNSFRNGKAFYKLEMIKVELVSAYGHQIVVEVEEYRKACPDAIAHSAAKIISRINAAGEKTTHALKSLCLRSKGIQVEEVLFIGIDSLGFDLRVCSGTQVQTLRFAFGSRATSEYSAERQLNDLLFPRGNQKLQKVKQAQ